MSPAQEQKKKIISGLESIWMAFHSSKSLIIFLRRIAVVNKVELKDLTDDMIEKWLAKESDYIYQSCTGSVLNG